LTLFALIALFSCVQGTVYKSERELRQDIFNGYDKNVRPVKRASTAVPFQMSVTPLNLKSMDEKERVIVMDSWILMKWTDEYLQWNPSEYDNITELRVSPFDIWKPDLTLYSATPDTSLHPIVQTNAIAYSNGMMLWVPPFTIRSSCPQPSKSNANKNFAECNIRFGSWTYSGKLLDLQLSSEKVDLTNFADFNPDWKLSKIVANRESKLYPCCPDEYPLVNFNVTLKRRRPFESHMKLFK